MSDNYKRVYSKAEADDLVAWIDKVHPKGELTLSPGVHIKDLERFSAQVKHIVSTNYDNPTFSGQISMMLDVKERYSEDSETE